MCGERVSGGLEEREDWSFIYCCFKRINKALFFLQKSFNNFILYGELGGESKGQTGNFRG